MTDSFVTRCAKCLRQYAAVARVVCLCGAITAAPVIHSITNKGDVDSSPRASVALSTATSAGAVTMYYGDPVTNVERAGAGPGFFSVMANTPARHDVILAASLPGDRPGVYRPLLWTTDDGFAKAHLASTKVETS